MFVKGGAQGPGRGPKPGAPNAGRPPNEFTALMRGLATRERAIEFLEAILDGRVMVETKGGKKVVDARLFLDAHKYVTEHGYGRPPTVIQGGREPLRIEFVRE